MSTAERHETPDGDAVIDYLIGLLKDARETGKSVMMCVAESRDGGAAFEHGRFNVEDYHTSINMLGNLLFMITAGTRTPIEKALCDLTEVHAEFEDAYKNRRGIPL